MSAPRPPHLPVMLEEALHWLNLRPGRLYVDATLGAGGHSAAILDRLGESGTLIGIDRDPDSLAKTRARLEKTFMGSDFRAVHGNYDALEKHLHGLGVSEVTGGLLVDLGVSSMQLDTAERGFSFSKEARLDMRMDTSEPVTAHCLTASGLTAETVVNTYSEAELVRVFSDFGEERLSKTIARALVETRRKTPFTTTTQLARLVQDLYRSRNIRSEIHPATRVFQALRMEVNDELGSLSRLLEKLPGLLAPGARAVFLTFHSLEDRCVKRFFQQEAKDCLCPPRLPICQCGHQATFKPLTPKPVTPPEAEVAQNPRSRSAKLRAYERL